jgi:DNA-binding NarL/FixJ family response regulator
LQDAIAWSYDLLAPEHQESFRRLSVFAGGCSFESVVAVSQPVPEAESGQDFVDSDQQAFAAVTALVEANILRRDDTEDNDTRYQMLETIREFGFGQLNTHGEEPEVRRAHACLMVAIAEEAEDALVGPEQRRWYQRLDAEHENLRAALQWCITASEAELAQRLAAALWRYWAVRGFLLEARSWLEQALSMPGAPAVAPLVHAKALHRQGNVAIDLGDYVAARRRCEESLAICQSLDDSGGIASALNGLGLVAAFEGDYVSAATFHSAALERRRALDDLLGLGNSLTNLGNALHAQGDVTGAERLLREALQVRQAMGDSGSVAYAYLNIAELAHGRGDQAEALELFEKSLSLFQQIGDQLGVAYALHILGVVHGDAGDGAKAMPLQREALILRRDMGDRRGQIECIEGIASLLLIAPPTSSERLAALRLVAAATSLRENIGAPRPPAEHASHRRLVDVVQAAMAEDQFRTAWNQGQRMTLADTVDQAASIAAAYTPPPTAASVIGGLTNREIDVLRLVARGLTNREIADELFLSPRTVHSHLYAIFRKLDVSSRSAATRYALNHDIT